MLPIETFSSLVLPRNVIMLEQLLMKCMPYYLSSDCLREVTSKTKFQTYNSESGCGCLRKVLLISASK